MKRGLFITIEGIEGAGKSTAMEVIEQFLHDRNLAFIKTREPGGTEIAEAIRHVVLHQRFAEEMVPDAELLLVFASRAQHIARVIKPALAEGKIVLCDRFTDTSFAYQGTGRGIPEARIEIIEEWVQQGLQPNLTLLLDLPVRVGMERAKKRSALDRIEAETMAFFERVRQGYLDRAKKYAERYRVVDSSLPMDKMQEAIRKVLAEINFGM